MPNEPQQAAHSQVTGQKRTVSSTDIDNSDYKNSLISIFSELLLSLLPLLVLAIVLVYQAKGTWTLLESPEWAFAAAILFGQTIVKVVTGMIHEWIIPERVGFFVSSVIVLGLVPSLIVLALILTANTPSLGLTIGQLALFVLSVVCFVLFGTLGHAWGGKNRDHTPSRNESLKMS